MKNFIYYSPASKKTQIIQDFVIIGTVTILFFHSFSFDLVLEKNSYYIIKYLGTLRSQLEEYTRLLRKFFILRAVIWASPFINIQENFRLFCFFTYTNDFFSILPADIRAYLFIKFRQKFQSSLLLEPLPVLET